MPPNHSSAINDNWVVPKKIHTPPTEEISAVQGGELSKSVCDVRTGGGIVIQIRDVTGNWIGSGKNVEPIIFNVT